MNQLLYFGSFKYRSSLLPVSKSLFNRIIFILSFLDRVTVIKTYSLNIDTNVMIDSLRGIGKRITVRGNVITIFGNNHIVPKYSYFNFKNSGITARIVSLLLLLKSNVSVVLDGSSEMRRRPLYSLVNIYSLFCSSPNIRFLCNYGFFPIKTSVCYNLYLRKSITIGSSLSSQFLTSLIINLPLFHFSDINICLKNVVSLSYIYMTVKLMNAFGINISINGSIITYIRSSYSFSSNVLNFIEADYSSFSYIVFSYFVNSMVLSLNNINFSSIQSEIKFIKFFSSIGYKIRGNSKRINFRHCCLVVRSICVNCSIIIDTSMILPILVFSKVKRIKLYNIYNWNFKESKRLFVIIRELKKLGCFIKHGKNWIIILMLTNIRSVLLNTYYDHRIFMIFFPLIFYNRHIAICNPNNIKKTYPMFLRNENNKN
ncbi:hypothetical protein [Candidatus Vidania fulgoroideorum]